LVSLSVNRVVLESIKEDLNWAVEMFDAPVKVRDDDV